MVEKASFKTVEVLVNGKTEEIKMEQGVSFENKSSIYKVDEDLNLKRYYKTTNVWETASSIVMRNYQWKAFQNVANNDGDAKSYTKADIDKAMKLYKNREFKTDMSKDLPSGYRIERPILTSAENMVQAYVTNGNDSVSATLKFKYDAGVITNRNEIQAESVNENVAQKPLTDSQRKEYERYGNFTVTTKTFVDQEEEETVTQKTFSDGSYSEKRSYSPGAFEYTEYYPNGNRKFYQRVASYITAGYDFTIYDENKKDAVLYDDSYEGSQALDGIEDCYEYDSKGRITFDGHDWYKYDDKNKTVTISDRKDWGITTKYKMGTDGCAAEELSHYYLGETGKVIDLANDKDLKALIKDLKIREQQ